MRSAQRLARFCVDEFWGWLGGLFFVWSCDPGRVDASDRSRPLALVAVMVPMIICAVRGGVTV